MFKKLCSCNNIDVGLLFLRLGMGAVFLAHGFQKAGNIEGVTTFVSGLGFPPFFGPILIAVEVLGGFALLTGVFTRLASFFIAIEMAFAIWLVRLSQGFIGGYEFELMLLLAALTLYFSGPGKYAVAKKMY